MFPRAFQKYYNELRQTMSSNNVVIIYFGSLTIFVSQAVNQLSGCYLQYHQLDSEFYLHTTLLHGIVLLKVVIHPSLHS